MIRVRRTLVWASVLATAVALTGCSAPGSGGSADSAGAPALVDQEQGERAGGGAPAGEAGAAGSNEVAKAPEVQVAARVIIYRGTLTVRVDDVNVAAAKATGIVTTAGGFVGGDRRSTGGAPSEASLTLRVPADKFGAVVDQLARELGKEENREISTEDVTEQSLDLDARIKTQQARVDSGRRLLAQAKSLSDLVMLESELAKREADLASLEAKKRRLDDLTALSTITLTLLDPHAAATDDDDPGFLGGLKAGWSALVASLGVMLTVLGALLPWLLVLGLPALAVVWLTRRARRQRPGTPAVGAAPEPTPATPAD